MFNIVEFNYISKYNKDYGFSETVIVKTRNICKRKRGI